MEETGKTAFVGDGDSITVFKAAGVAAFAAENESKAKEILRKNSKRIPRDFSYGRTGAVFGRFFFSF